MKLEQANTIVQTVVGEAAAPVSGASDSRSRRRPSLRASGSNRCQINPPQERVTPPPSEAPAGSMHRA